MVFKTKLLHFKVENTPIRLTNGKRKFKRILIFLFVENRKLFVAKLSFQEFRAMKYLKKFWVHFVVYGQGKYFYRRNFLYLLRFYRRFFSFFTIFIDNHIR